jgi:hypothetical protein
MTRSEVERARARLEQIIEEVCGRCELNCCLQGTMVGSDDARRIAKAARLSAVFRQRLVDGLHRRGAELRRDLEGLERTAKLIETRFAQERPAEVEQLRIALNRWREYCDFIQGEFEPSLEHLQRCLVFSGVRATALRAMRHFPGGEQVLPMLAGTDTSFRAGKRGVKADRCLFHVDGCLVPTAKPHKCADFYCASQPGLVNVVVERLSFEEFTLAHFVPRTRSELLCDLEIELTLGAASFEPKAILGGDEPLAERMADLLRAAFGTVRVERIEGGHLDAAVDLPDIRKPRPGEAVVVQCASLDANGLYELAVEVVRARGESMRPLFIVVAQELVLPSGLEHLLWESRAISQPLSALNLVCIVDE